MRNRGFTLLEIVLAIGLSGAVLGLLATAINLYLVRVDASRTQVESAQLARTLLNLITSDLQAARYDSPSASSGDGSEASAPADPATVQGIFGTSTELRIDRSAVWQWASVAQQIDLENPSAAVNTSPLQSYMPQTIRYVLGDGKELLASKLAAKGVSEEPTGSGHAGLYREQISTAAWMSQDTAAAGNLTGNTEDAELIAPEVVDIIFAYYDGMQLLDEWDSSLAAELPKAVEIRITLLEEPFEQAVERTPNQRDELRQSQENLVEYRRFVRLPNIGEPPEATFPQPIQQAAGLPVF